MGPTVKPAPLDRRTEQRRCYDRRELSDGEVTEDEVTVVVFPILMRIYGYPRFGRRIIGATSPVSMVTQCQCAVVHRPSSATACSGERGYDFYKP